MSQKFQNPHLQVNSALDILDIGGYRKLGRGVHLGGMLLILHDEGLGGARLYGGGPVGVVRHENVCRLAGRLLDADHAVDYLG